MAYLTHLIIKGGIMIKKSGAYKAIKTFYGDRVAERSQQPLMKHIDEGLVILDSLNVPDYVKEAFCLHPLIQNDEDSSTWSKFDVKWEAVGLAYAYRMYANAYLCRLETDHVTSPSQLCLHIGGVDVPHEVLCMLLADKVQNNSDFLKYHQNHDRYIELANYFKTWIGFITTHPSMHRFKAGLLSKTIKDFNDEYLYPFLEEQEFNND